MLSTGEEEETMAGMGACVIRKLILRASGKVVKAYVNEEHTVHGGEVAHLYTCMPLVCEPVSTSDSSGAGFGT